MCSCVYSKCCCCIDLKAGCFIIGYLSMIVNIYKTIHYGLPLAAFFAALTVNNEADVGPNTTIEDYKEAYVISIAVIVTIIAIIFISSLISLIFDIVLVVGLHKNKPGHVKAYLVAAVISLIATVITSIWRVRVANGNVKFELCDGFISSIFELYFILVIRSMYLRMNNEHRGITFCTDQSGYTPPPLVHNSTGISGVPNGAYGYHHQAQSNNVVPNSGISGVTNGVYGHHQAPSNQISYNNGVSAPEYDPCGFGNQAPPSYNMCGKM